MSNLEITRLLIWLNMSLFSIACWFALLVWLWRNL